LSTNCQHFSIVTVPTAPLGVLTLDTAFPRIPGDLGCPETYAYPVLFETVAGATPETTVHHRDNRLLPAFAAAGRRLADRGAVGVVTTCGFLARWQKELTTLLPVPVATSALLQVAWLERLLPAGKRVGIVTYSAADLPPDTLAAVGASPYSPVEGVDPAGHFARTIRHGATTLDRALMAADVVAAARRLVGAHRDVGAVLLECANMPPYRDDVTAAVGMPVFDAADLVAWFHAGLAGVPSRYARRDLW
jgi:Asp/Glu/Hydantoin racemase